MKWQPISTAPRDNNIEVCVIKREPHVFSGVCRLTDAGWIDADNNRLLDIRPTHWRVAATCTNDSARSALVVG